MKIQQVARLTGVTVRTLHYYDEIGLLRPREVTQAGYRLYDQNSLEKLQQILFFRELGFSLTEIKRILQNPDFDRAAALRNHRELLEKKRERIDKLLNLVDESLEGEREMSFKEFDMTDIENAKDKYTKEAAERWGTTEAYAESERKTTAYGADKWQEVSRDMGAIFAEFAEISSAGADSPQAQAVVKKLQAFITDNFYHCSKEILRGLGEMYAGDERFKENIDKNGKGTADFASKAIAIYCRN